MEQPLSMMIKGAGKNYLIKYKYYIYTLRYDEFGKQSEMNFNNIKYRKLL